MGEDKYSAAGLEGKLLKQTYLLEKRVAQGGMAWVYRGQHVTLKQTVAIKILFDEYTTHRTIATRFLNEAQIQFSLRHPHIVQVSDMIDERGILGMVMEWIDGEDLHRWHDGHPQATLPQLWTLMAPVLEALAYIHDQGLVHRDLKPANILLQRKEGRLLPKVADFGIAKMGREQAAGITRTGSHIGTLRYMSPEQISDSKSVDLRTDVYACGIILYELLSGQTPFNGEAQEVMFQQVTMPPASLQTMLPTLSPDVEAVVMRCLAKEREARFQDCRALLEALHNALSSAVGTPIEEKAAALDLIAVATPGDVASARLPSGSLLPNPVNSLAFAETGSLPFGATPAKNKSKAAARPASPYARVVWVLGAFAVVTLVLGIGGGILLNRVGRTTSSQGQKARPTQPQVPQRGLSTRRAASPVRRTALRPTLRPDARLAARVVPAPLPVRPRVSSNAPKRRWRRRRRRRRVALVIVRRKVVKSRLSPPDVRLRPMLRLRVFSRPAGAIVWRGNRRLGPTPLVLKGREGTRITLQLKKEKYETTRVTWRFRKGAPVRKIWTLKLFSPDPFGGSQP